MDSDWAVFVEDNDNNRRQKYPLLGGQVLIQVQLMYTLQFCDNDEEKKTCCQNTGITRDASGFSSSRLNRNFALLAHFAYYGVLASFIPIVRFAIQKDSVIRFYRILLNKCLPCISFRNINRGTLKDIRESISTTLSSILGKQQTRGRYTCI